MGYHLWPSLLVVFLGISTLQAFTNKDGWMAAPWSRFPWIVSIKGRFHEHLCSGMLISKNFILTAAICIDVLGSKPIVVVGPHNVSDDRWMPGVKEVRAKTAHLHPKWTGSAENGYNVALLQLRQEIDVMTPDLADETVQIYPSVKLWALRFGPVLEVAQFDVVQRKLCPHLRDLGSGMLCAYSEAGFMTSGDAGGPMLIASDSIYDDLNGTEMTAPNHDIVVGVISHANFSSLDDSGAACIDIRSVYGWIQQIALKEQPGIHPDILARFFTAFAILASIGLIGAYFQVPPLERELNAVFCSIMECCPMEIKYNNRTIDFLLNQIKKLYKMCPMRRPYWRSEEEWRKDVRSAVRHLRQALKIVQRHMRFNIHTFYTAEDAEGLAALICGATQEFVEKWTVHKNVTAYLSANDALEDAKTFNQCLKYIMDDQGRTQLAAGFSEQSAQEWLLVREHFQRERDRVEALPEVEIGRRLGDGGQGNVYEAMWNGERVAVKKLMGTGYGTLNESEFAALYAEVFRTASLASDYVVHVHGVTKSGSIIMELADCDLRAWYLTNPTWEQRLCVLAKAARALDFVHDQGIVHRDVKSTNFLIFYVNQQLNVKIADFGISMRRRDAMNSIATRVAGTLQWMAPELSEGHCPDEMTDVYSFGVVIYEVAAGYTPYAGVMDGSISMLKRSGREPCSFNVIPNERRCRKELHALAKKCISRQSDNRPTIGDVRRQLAELLASAPNSEG